MAVDWAEMYRDYYQPLVRFVHRHVWDEEEARDIAQETFARALGQSPDHPRAWLFQVAANLARDEARAAIRRRAQAPIIEQEAAHLQSRSRDPAMEADLADQRERARRALAQLNEKDREVLLLWDSGMNYQEIAESSGLAPGAIGTTLARARRKLVEAHAGLED